MKNNKELFVKYLDERLSEPEKKSFEEELIKNLILNEEFSEFSEQYNSLKKNIDVDERYFETVIPNARKRLEKRETPYFYGIAYLLPIILVGLFLYNQFPLDKAVDNNYNFEYLLESFTDEEEVAMDLISDAYNTNSNYRIDNKLLASLYETENSYDESLYDYLSNSVNTSEIENELFNQLSEKEFNVVYNEINSKKF